MAKLKNFLRKTFVGKNLGKIAAVAAAPFTGGASLAYLPMASTVDATTQSFVQPSSSGGRLGGVLPGIVPSYSNGGGGGGLLSMFPGGISGKGGGGGQFPGGGGGGGIIDIISKVLPSLFGQSGGNPISLFGVPIQSMQDAAGIAALTDALNRSVEAQGQMIAMANDISNFERQQADISRQNILAGTRLTPEEIAREARVAQFESGQLPQEQSFREVGPISNQLADIIGQRLTATPQFVTERIQVPSASQFNYQPIPFEDTLNQQLQLAQESIAQQAQRRGLSGVGGGISGLEIEGLGRSGVDLAIQSALARQEAARNEEARRQNVFQLNELLKQTQRGELAGEENRLLSVLQANQALQQQARHEAAGLGDTARGQLINLQNLAAASRNRAAQGVVSSESAAGNALQRALAAATTGITGGLESERAREKQIREVLYEPDLGGELFTSGMTPPINLQRQFAQSFQQIQPFQQTQPLSSIFNMDLTSIYDQLFGRGKPKTSLEQTRLAGQLKPGIRIRRTPAPIAPPSSLARRY